MRDADHGTGATLNERIDAIAKAEGITTTQLAQAAGVTWAAAKRWRLPPPQGAEPRAAHLHAIAELCEVAIEDLLESSDASTPSDEPLGPTSIGARIDRARRAAGLSKSELGRRCEKGYRTVQAWIRGEQEPSAESLLALATALGVSADELLGTQVAAHASTGHEEMRATVGDRIREARLAAGFENASEFGRLVGVTPTTVYRWERGQVVPTIFALHDIARACGASMEWLVSGAESDDFRRGVVAAAEAAARVADV